MRSVRWVVTLEGNRRDIEFLLGESSEQLSASIDLREVLLELDDPDHEVPPMKLVRRARSRSTQRSAV